MVESISIRSTVTANQAAFTSMGTLRAPAEPATKSSQVNLKAESPRADCKQCARLAMRTIIRRVACAVHREICRF
jgi:hypothetical protein